MDLYGRFTKMVIYCLARQHIEAWKASVAVRPIAVSLCLTRQLLTVLEIKYVICV